VEKKIDLGWLYPGMFGRNDALVGELFGVLYVYDFKYGAGVAVEVEENPQEMYYGLGAVQGDAYEEVELVIVQPRAHHPKGPGPGGPPTTDALQAWGKEVLLPRAEATTAPDAPLSVGEHCRFCPVLAICPAQQAHAITVAQEAFADTPAAPPAPETLTPDKLRRVLDAAGIVEEWLNACRSYVRAMLERGALKPEEVGYKLVHGKKGHRKWQNESAAAALLGLELGEDAYVKTLLSPAQAEKALGKDRKATLKGMIVDGAPGVALVPLSDAREAIAPAITVFEEVEI
jgi:hypothetical protein